jgi:hypothetical protein
MSDRFIAWPVIGRASGNACWGKEGQGQGMQPHSGDASIA